MTVYVAVNLLLNKQNGALEGYDILDVYDSEDDAISATGGDMTFTEGTYCNYCTRLFEREVKHYDN